MSKCNKKFYIAAAYDRKEEMVELFQKVERLSGWKCTARWPLRLHDNAPATECAYEDYNDIDTADVLVLVVGKSARGGTWVEFGIALEMDKRIILIMEKDVVLKLNVFAFMTGIWRYVSEKGKFSATISKALLRHEEIINPRRKERYDRT